MNRRAALGLGLISAAWLWTSAARAQEVATNLADLAEEAFSGEHSIYLPGLTPWEWQAYSLDGGLPLWVDCSQLPCADWLPASTNADTGPASSWASQLTEGIPLAAVQLTKNVLTGETLVQPAGSTDIVANIAAPDGYHPGARSEDRGVWWQWQQLTNCPDCWGIEGEIPPPTVTLTVLLADSSDYATYESNVEAQAEAEAATEAAAASATSMSSRVMPMDDEDPGDGGGDPCSITNLTQPFNITGITQGTNGTTITWQSCQIFRYIVLSAGVLSTNTAWAAQSYTSYVWGRPNASSTTWTDTTATASVMQQFYKVERINGSRIAAGGNHSLVVTNGSLWAFGADGNSQLGDGAFTNEWSPEEVSSNGCNPQGISGVTAVAAGYDYGVAVDAGGIIWSWGDGGSGQLGNGGNTNVHTPSSISGVSDVVSVAAGFDHTLVLRSDGTVWAFGNNANGDNEEGGQLGAGYLGGALSTNLPVQSLIPTGTGIVAIAAGDGFSVALDATGLVWGWGGNGAGEIGASPPPGRDVSTNLPVPVAGISNVIAIAAGEGHTLALTTDKRVWTWGANGNGQLGDGTTTGRPTPEPVAMLSNVVAIAAGYNFSVAVTSNGFVYAWGYNYYGELATNGPPELDTPTRVAGISNAVWVSAHPYGSHVLAVTVSGGTNQYFGWGADDYGQTGNGTNAEAVYAPAGPLPFVHYNPCGPCVQLGNNGTFTATAAGTLFLFFNDNNYGDNSGSYTATVYGVASQVVVPGNNQVGIAIGTVSNGATYSYTADGRVNMYGDPYPEHNVDPSGYNEDGVLVDCDSAHGSTNSTGSARSGFPCDDAICYSLVGKIE